jgi:hypothetical protein
MSRWSAKSTGMWPHLTFAEVALLVGARTLWKAPDWGIKFLMLASAWRRFRLSK